ncbi:MAG: GPW/gp25 family protein [Kineosporiaceae bacterium]
MSGTPDIIGVGWAFPAGVAGSGGVRLVGGAEEVEGAIRMILSTRPGERLMRPEFGCDLASLLFAPLNSNTLALAENAVRAALVRWEPRIDVDDVRAVGDVGSARIDIRVDYVVKATNDHRNLVHPFYVIPHEELQP